MALSNVEIIRQQGGLQRLPESQDGISGLLFYGSSTSGFNKYFSITDVTEVVEGTVEFYHIDRFFKKSNGYPLYVQYVMADPTDFSEIVDLKNYSESEIRQLGIISLGLAYSPAQLNAIDVQADICEAEFAPLQTIYSAQVADITSLATTATSDAPRATLVIGEDLGGEAGTLKLTNPHVGMVGAVLGAIASLQVHESVAAVKKINMLGEDFTIPGFVDGTSLKSVSKSLLDVLDSYHYLFLRKFVGFTGVYLNYSYTASRGDFETIQDNRVYDKAFRTLRAVYVPELNSPSYVDASGKLSVSTITYFKELGRNALNSMLNAGEISAFNVDIDSNQNVLSTSKLEIIADIVPVGTNKTISIKLGFVLSV